MFLVQFESVSFDLSVGLEEDFKAWKDGFVKSVFPVLLGEVAMNQLTSSSGSTSREDSCECGGKRKKDCSKEKLEASNEQVLMFTYVRVHTHA